MTPLFNTTPETEDAYEDDVLSDCPIAAPPDTTNAPEFVDNEAWELIIFTVPPINALPAKPSPPTTVIAPELVLLDDVLLV